MTLILVSSVERTEAVVEALGIHVIRLPETVEEESITSAEELFESPPVALVLDPDPWYMSPRVVPLFGRACRAGCPDRSRQ